MAYRKPLQIQVLFLIFLATLLTQVSCEKFSGSQTVPAYLHIDSIYVTTEYNIQGTASHNITDAWIYVDDELIGAFELPATVPILKEGSHKVTIKPGVKKDGIATTRIAYPFYNPIIKTVKLISGSTVSLGILSTSYISTSSFIFMEDFEQVALKLDTANRSTVVLGISAPGTPQTFEGFHSGMVTMDSTNAYFECETHDKINIPSSEVYLEMNFNTNNDLTVGLLIYTNLILYEVPVMTLFPTNNKWKKIYIDLTTTLNAYANSTSFRLTLANAKDSNVDHAVILMDNIKIVTRKNS